MSGRTTWLAFQQTLYGAWRYGQSASDGIAIEPRAAFGRLYLADHRSMLSLIARGRKWHMTRLAFWILDHKRIVGLTWLAVAVVSLVSMSSASGALSNTFSLPGQPGYIANQAIIAAYGNGGDNPPMVPVVTLPSGTTVASPGVKAQIGDVMSRIQRAAPAARVVSYASTGSRLFVSSDGRTTFGLVYLPIDPHTGDSLTAQTTVQQALAGATIAGAPVHITGFSVLESSGSSGGGNSALVETLLGAVGALLVLLFVFGSALAIVPLASAFVSIPTTFLVIWGLTRITDISSIVEYLVSLIGLGIAIDYSLLIVLRWREERANGLDNEAAVRRALETAGKAVVFSGTTVAIGMLALVVLPVPMMQSIGYGGLLIPLVSVLVSVTLLPVVLATVGPRLDWPHRSRPRTSRFWSAWGRLMVRRRWIAAGAALAILAAFVAPSFSMTLGFPTADSLARSGDAYVGLRSLEQSGIGSGALLPFEVLVKDTDPRTVAARAAQVDGMRGALAPDAAGWHANGSALVVAIPSSDGTSAAGKATLSGLRATAKTLPGSVQVGGAASTNEDFRAAVYGNFPLVALVLSVLTFLLLARAFRSVLLPLKAVGMVLISVAAAMGFMTVIWQDGHGSQMLWGVQATHSITMWIPIMVFAFLFGISMDYEVFLLSRMRETYDATGSTRAAVVSGIGSTGRLVTSAALILFLAFAALASGPEVNVKIIGTGLAAGILLDATVIRMLLVPALVAIFGRWNWWVPMPLAKILRIADTATPAFEPQEEFELERTA
jgi:RND superfamily putative drug exporter